MFQKIFYIRFILLFFGGSIFSSANAQIGGTGIFANLDAPMSARSLAWGGYLIAQPQTDIQYAVHNPALLNESILNQYGASFGTLIAGSNGVSPVRHGGAGYAFKIKKQLFSFHAQYIDYGTMKGYDEGGNYQTDIIANELKFTIGYAKKVHKHLNIGAQTGFAYSVLGPYVSNGAFLNLGALYSRSDTGVQVGLVVKNLGYQIAVYKDAERESLPFNVQLGASYKPVHMPFRFHAVLHNLQRWDLTFNQYLSSGQIDLSGQEVNNNPANFLAKGFRHLAIGGELVLGKNMGILFGYNHQRRMEMSPEIRPGLAGFGWGIKFKVWKYHLTYASASLFPGQNANTLSLTLIPQSLFTK